jgi:hypothetical protein
VDRANVETGRSELLFETSEILFEAPNWTPRRARLVVNGADVSGRWRWTHRRWC